MLAPGNGKTKTGRLWVPSVDAITCLPVQIPGVSAPLPSTASLGTEKLNGIRPEAYLRYVLTRIADHATHRIAERHGGRSPISSSAQPDYHALQQDAAAATCTGEERLRIFFLLLATDGSCRAAYARWW